jgi:hypothetical protein
LGKPAAAVEQFKSWLRAWYFGRLCSELDDIAARMRRNETRSLSLRQTAQVLKQLSPNAAQM